MKILPFVALIFLCSCGSNGDVADEDIAFIEKGIFDYHNTLKQAYNGAPINTDSLINHFFAKDVYYVTYWGLSEPIDTTKTRIRNALPLIRDYENRLERVKVKVYGNGAYAFFILRQTYTLNGILMDEYLPTTYVLERIDNRWVVVHSQRSADFQTTQHLIEVALQREEPIIDKK